MADSQKLINSCSARKNVMMITENFENVKAVS